MNVGARFTFLHSWYIVIPLGRLTNLNKDRFKYIYMKMKHNYMNYMLYAFQS